MATNKSLVNQETCAKIKYTAIATKENGLEDGTQDGTHGIDEGEKVSLLENMEKVSISDTPYKQENTITTKDNAEPESFKKQAVATSMSMSKSDLNCEEKYMSMLNNHSVLNSEECKTDTLESGSRHLSRKTSAPVIGERETKSHDKRSGDTNLDIVRKMSEPYPESNIPWRKIGPYSVLKQKRCQRIYAKSGRADDLALFYNNGKFHVMEAWCSHMGGPLFDGDIEDYNGKCHVMCPWHSYMFDLETGMNEIGLQQTVYDLKLDNAQIFVRYKSEVSIEPLRKKSEAQEVKGTQPPNSKSKHGKPARKDSVLETVMRLS